MDPIVKGPKELAEDRFYDSELIKIEYFRRYRETYDFSRDSGFLNPYRNYLSILGYLGEIREYNTSHANSFAKRLKKDCNNWNSCEAVVSEMIVYHSYIRLISA